MTTYNAAIGEQTFEIDLENGGTAARLDGKRMSMNHAWFDSTFSGLNLILDGRSFDFRIEEVDGTLQVTYAGHRYDCQVIDKHLAELKKRAGEVGGVSGKTVIKAPMPGLVVKVTVEAGQDVKKGDRLLVLEAMKMENDVKAPRDGKVTKLAVGAGDVVEGGRELATIE